MSLGLSVISSSTSASTNLASLSIALSSLIGTLVGSGSSTDALTAEVIYGDRSRSISTVKYISLLLCFLTAFTAFIQSARYFVHASYLITTLGSDLPLSYVQRAVVRGGNFWALGLRALYFATALLMWIFGPIPMFFCSIFMFAGAMKFKDSPVIELTVGGTALSFEQDNGSFHVGTSVWPCSLVLAKFAERWILPSSASTPNPYASLLSFSGKRAIELGAGCGPAGIALTVLGLDIILTDIAPVMPALRRNLKRNRPALPKTPKHAQLYWNNAEQIRSLNPPFDLVIAADVVYMEDSAAQLVSAMDALAAPNGAILLGYQLRSPEAHRVFWDRCSEVFTVIEKVPHEDLHSDYAYEETDVYIFKKSK